MIRTNQQHSLKNLIDWNLSYELGLTTKSVKKGEHILRESQKCHFIYFVVKGYVRIYYLDLNGNEMTHWFAADNSIFTSPFSYFKDESNILNMEALEDTELILISRKQQQQIMAQFDTTGEAISDLFLEFGMTMSRRVMSIHTETAEQRYLKLLEEYPTIFQKAKLSHIASYLGITPQSLSRIRKNI